MAYIGQLLRNKWENFLFLFLWTTTIYHFYPQILMHITDSANKGVKVNKMRKRYDLRMHMYIILLYAILLFPVFNEYIFKNQTYKTCWIKKISHQLFDLLLSFKHSSPVPKRKVLCKNSNDMFCYQRRKCFKENLQNSNISYHFWVSLQIGQQYCYEASYWYFLVLRFGQIRLWLVSLVNNFIAFLSNRYNTSLTLIFPYRQNTIFVFK